MYLFNFNSSVLQLDEYINNNNGLFFFLFSKKNTDMNVDWENADALVFLFKNRNLKVLERG